MSVGATSTSLQLHHEFHQIRFESEFLAVNGNELTLNDNDDDDDYRPTSRSHTYVEFYCVGRGAGNRARGIHLISL